MQRIKIEPGKQVYTMSPFHEPRAYVEPGETFVVETKDGSDGTVTEPTDVPSEELRFPFNNPETGPIYVRGAEPGDTLVVEILDIKPLWNYALTFSLQRFGGLVGTMWTRMLHPPFEERVHKVEIKDGFCIWDENIRFPYLPFYGCIGTAPQITAMDCVGSGPHGGNMDVPDCCPGNKVYLPVKVEGAYLFLGDVMASQGDGELCGTCGEHEAVGTIRCDVIKGYTILWPRVESQEYIMCIGNARPMEDALRIAYAELIDWLQDDWGFDKVDAYLLLSHLGRVRVGNMVDTQYSLVAKFPKEYLPEKRVRELKTLAKKEG